MGTILPSSVSYQVTTLVGRTSLDEYSVVKTNDAIQPLFINPVFKDPDLAGLLMYLQNPEGEVVGKKVYYLLKTAASRTDPLQSPARAETRDPVYGENAETLLVGPEEEEKTENRPIDPAEERETRIYVSQLDKDLPAFPFPENLKLGAYSLIFEVLGEKQTLYQTERRFYYIGDAEFTLGDIQSYLPGLSAGSFLIPPGLSVMLETQVTMDERLDPYIVWHDGNRRIGEGRIADGSGCFLWEAPAQTGFHTIRAELFPFRPEGVSYGTGNSPSRGRSSIPELRGKVKELVLPVSAKGGKPGLFVPNGEKILHWYQFAGNVRDSMANGNRENLAGNDFKDLRWVPSEGIYGLLVKTGDTYRLPSPSFVMDEDTQRGASFLLRVNPLAEETLFTASFKAAASPGNALTMTIVYQAQSLQLNLESGGLRATGSLPLDAFPEDFTGASAPSRKGFITVEAGFYVRGNIFTAALGVAEDGNFQGATMLPGLFQADVFAVPEDAPAGLVEIELSDALSGEISCILGTFRKDRLQPLAIFDELALISRNPVLLSNNK